MCINNRKRLKKVISSFIAFLQFLNLRLHNFVKFLALWSIIKSDILRLLNDCFGTLVHNLLSDRFVAWIVLFFRAVQVAQCTLLRPLLIAQSELIKWSKQGMLLPDLNIAFSGSFVFKCWCFWVGDGLRVNRHVLMEQVHSFVGLWCIMQRVVQQIYL
jgi:hypothetical protein